MSTFCIAPEMAAPRARPVPISSTYEGSPSPRTDSSPEKDVALTSICPTWCREYARGFDNQDCPSNQKKTEKQLPQRDLAAQEDFGEEKSPDGFGENDGEGIAKRDVGHTGECTAHPETRAESLEGEKSLGGAGAWIERFAGANQN